MCTCAQAGVRATSAAGAPFMLVNWFNGIATVGAATACTWYGLDVGTILNHIPFVTEDTAQLATASTSCVAGAACINSLTLPVRLYLLSRAAPRFIQADRIRSEQQRAFRSWMREHLRSNPDAPRRLAKRWEKGAEVRP